MKIRTIIGVLLVLALVLGSTGAAFAAQGDGDCDGDGPVQDRLRDGSCNQDRNRDCNCDEDCAPNGDGQHGPNYTD